MALLLAACAPDRGAMPATTATASPPPGGRFAFVSSGVVDGNVGGLAGADAFCTDAAAATGRAGTYRAWLSDVSASALSRLSDNGAWYLADGTTVVADSPSAIPGGLTHAINQTESGTILEDTRVWTGTNADGSRSPINCTNWTDDTTNVTSAHPVDGLAGVTAELAGWTDSIQETCRMEYHLYCFQD